MKRIVAIVTVVTIISLMFATFVYADDTVNVPQWFKDMISWRKAQIDQAQKDGTITEDQAGFYKEHIDQMEKFHTQYGFPGGMGFGGFGGCGGAGYGYGRGMMGGYF